MTAPFQTSRKTVDQLKKQISRKFQVLALLPFSTWKITNAKKKTEELYEELDRLNRRAYWVIAMAAYQESVERAAQAGFVAAAPTNITEKWVDNAIAKYNPITKYFYDSEKERKRMRLAEALAIDHETGARGAIRGDVKTAADLWWRQSEQYAIDAEDQATETAYADAGVEYVEWVTAEDDRVCKTCRERNRQIFKIDEVPDKPHYRCRCYTVPVKPDKAQKSG